METKGICKIPAADKDALICGLNKFYRVKDMSEATMTSSAKAEISAGVQMSAHLLNKDIGAMSDEMLANCPGGKARCGFDLIYEVASINRLFANLIQGVGNDVPPPNGWLKAPTEYHNKEEAQKDVAASVSELLAALDAVPENELGKVLESPMGAMPLAKLAGLVGAHMMYHSGQLNYIQTLHGDDTFHWMEA